MRADTDPGTALLCVYSAQQLVPALAALLQHRANCGTAMNARALVLVWCPPSLDPGVAQRRVGTVAALAAAYPWLDVLGLSGEVSRRIQGHLLVADRARELAAHLPGGPVAQVFYGHDVSADFMAQAAMRAWPHATRVCFGDAWGVVYTNRHFEDQTYPCRLSLIARPALLGRNCLARVRRRLARGSPRAALGPHLALPILPLDPGGDFFPSVPHEQVEFSRLRSVVERLAGAVPPGFGEACDGATLLLLGSYAESLLCAEDAELGLYRAIVRERLAPGTRLLVKPHPASGEGKISRLVAALRADGVRVERLDGKFDDVPAELLCADRPAVDVLSLSYASVSLTYIGHSAVTHALTTELIGRYFPPATIGWVKESNDLYLGQLEVARAQRPAEAVA